MTLDQALWETGRVAALSAFFALSASIISGQALRSSLLDRLVRNRELLSLHRFLTLCWLPLVAIHVAALTLDSVARIGPLDLLLPFQVSYAPLAIGLGTLGFDLLLVVTITSYLRGRLDATAWRWIHRLSYPMVLLFALHAVLAGTDFSRSVVLAPAAGVLAFTAVLTLARVAFGRLDQRV
ncbi:MAG TPA: ferric reductase-like transmembrane domain-containing protein [Candidatus Dormibacteraeota bacterium]|jgi:DMSO/TMAO reductase YedYZ heme-binding membrane subunit|nr:ferric reductase-like transmembrane domain-containing protein [Candidatus Dormibacteraeota bacterium]